MEAPHCSVGFTLTNGWSMQLLVKYAWPRLKGCARLGSLGSGANLDLDPVECRV